MRSRYSLQGYEPVAIPVSIGGGRKSPLCETYRWKDIAVSDDLAALELYAGQYGLTGKDYRVVDTEEQDKVVWYGSDKTYDRI